MSTAENVVRLPQKRESGECELVGHDYLLIEPGEYEAVFVHYETSARFSKKTNNDQIHAGGKIYLWFKVDPYGTGGLPPGIDRLVFLAYNAKSITKPFGLNGKFQLGRRSKCFKDFQRLIGTPQKRLSLNDYKGTLWKVRVKTVERNERQRKHSEDDQYSEVEQILGPA